jgi:hypothetical protein
MALYIPKTLQEFPVGAIRDPQIVKRIPAAGLEELRVDVQTLGNLMLCFDAQDEVEIVGAGDPHLLPDQIERDGAVLRVAGRNLGTYIRHGQKQKILMEVHLPAETKLSIRFTAGVVILNGGQGDVDIQGKFGEVAGISHAQHVRIQLRGGDVSLNELSGAATIRVDLGSVTLGWSELRGSEQIEVSCGLGGVDLLLPPGVAPQEDQGGIFKAKTVNTPQGTSIQAKIGFGGLDVLDWGIESPSDTD